MRLWVIESLVRNEPGFRADRPISILYPGTLPEAVKEAEAMAAVGHYRPKVRLAQPKDIFDRLAA